MKRTFRLPVLAGGIVMAVVLASLTPITSSHVYAQVAVYYNPYGQGSYGGYYNPYGQGPYGGYGQGYAASYGTNRNMFPNQNGMFGRRDYGYSDYTNIPFSHGNSVGYGIGPPVRAYGRASYYQPPYAPVYVPFGYGDQ